MSHHHVRRCRTCSNPLDHVYDRQMSTGVFWVNCQNCRDSNTSHRRARLGHGPVLHFHNNAEYEVERARVRGDMLPTHLPPGVYRPRDKYEERALGIPRQPEYVRRAFGGVPQHVHGPRDVYVERYQGYGSYDRGRMGDAPSAFFQKPNFEKPHAASTYLKTPSLEGQRAASAYLQQPGSDRPTARQASPDSDVEDQPSDPECSVCRDACPAENFPRLSRCSHEADICRKCLASWLTNQVESKSCDRITCPAEKCGVTLTHAEMKEFATEDAFARFDRLTVRTMMNNVRGFRYCLRPGCESGQIHDSGAEGNIFRCNACNFLVCTTHDEKMHVGETCAAYDVRRSRERRGEEEASVSKIRLTAKKCPGEMCGVWIEKDEGCDHMTCRRCYHQFCWVCCAPYEGDEGISRVGNSAHEKGCRHWREVGRQGGENDALEGVEEIMFDADNNSDTAEDEEVQVAQELPRTVIDISDDEEEEEEEEVVSDTLPVEDEAKENEEPTEEYMHDPIVRRSSAKVRFVRIQPIQQVISKHQPVDKTHAPCQPYSWKPTKWYAEPRTRGSERLERRAARREARRVLREERVQARRQRLEVRD